MYYNSDFDIRDVQLSPEWWSMFNTITLGFSAKDEIRHEKLLEQELMDFTDAMARRRERGGRDSGKYLKRIFHVIPFFFCLTGKIKSVCVGGSESGSPQATQTNMRVVHRREDIRPSGVFHDIQQKAWRFTFFKHSYII